MQTPWGTSQSIQPVAEGVRFISTAGHGGIKLDRKQNARIPDYMRRAGGWYEEDCEWSIPYVVLGFDSSRYGTAKDTLRNWFPDLYERFFNVVLGPGESHTKDEQTFLAQNADKYLVLAAWGDHEQGVPTGMVKVLAGRGGRMPSGHYPADTAYFLIPETDYTEPGRFVVDEKKHQKINP